MALRANTRIVETKSGFVVEVYIEYNFTFWERLFLETKRHKTGWYVCDLWGHLWEIIGSIPPPPMAIFKTVDEAIKNVIKVSRPDIYRVVYESGVYESENIIISPACDTHKQKFTKPPIK